MRYLKTTPINVLVAESGQIPMEERVELLTLRDVIKSKYYRDPNLKFISEKLNESSDTGTFITKIADEHIDVIYQMTGQSETIQEDRKKWKKLQISTEIDKKEGRKDQTAKQILKAKTIELIDRKYAGYYKIFTDASKTQNGTAIAAYDPQDNSKIAQTINNNFSITNAELLAIREAIRWVKDKQKDKIVILTDAKSACEALKNQDKALSNYLVYDIYQETTNTNMSIQWIPSHVGVEGNEVADQTAVNATKNRQDNYDTLTLGDTLKLAKREIWEKWTRKYKQQSTQKGVYHYQIAENPGKKIWSHQLGLTTQEKITISRLRSGHCLTKDRKYAWKWENNDLCDKCNETENIEHILYNCAKHNNIRIKYDILHKRKPLTQILKNSIPDELKSITKYLQECKIQI